MKSCCMIMIWIVASVSISTIRSDTSQQNTTMEVLSMCAAKIVQTHTSTNFLLIHSDVEDVTTEILRYNIPKTTLRYDKTFEIVRRYDHFDYYVFVVDSVDDLAGILEKIHNMSIYRPLQQALVVYTGQSGIRQFVDLLWYYFAFNVVLLTSNQQLYTYFPYKNGECGDNVEEVYLANCDDVANESIILYPAKVPLYVNGCELRLLPLEVPPYVLKAADPMNPGLEVTIAREVGKRINFTVKVVPHSFRETGYKYLAQGTFTGLYDLLHRRHGDLIFGMLRQNTSYAHDFDSTFIHLFDQVTWHVATAAEMSEWKNLTMIFTWKLWTLVFVCIFINSFSWWLVGRNRHDHPDYVQFPRVLLTSYRIILGGSTRSPKSKLLRSMFLVWTMSAILLVAAYQSKLVSLLTKTVFGHQVSTEEEIISLRLNFGYFTGVRGIFQDCANQPGYNLYKNYQPCPIVGNECIERAAYKRDFVVLKNHRQIRYLTQRILLFPSGRKRLYSMNKDIFLYLLRMITHKGFPYLRRINYLLLYMQQNGLIDKWDKDVAAKYKYDEPTVTKKLRLNHLQGVFMLIAIGLCLAVIAFVFEVCVGRKRKMCGYRKTNNWRYNDVQ